MTERSSGPEQEGCLARRNVLIESALGAAALPIVSATGADADVPRAAPAVGNNGDVDLPVNVSVRRLSLDPRTALLETMREHLGLTGAKKGCEHGQCGIGTMLAGGRRVLTPQFNLETASLGESFAEQTADQRRVVGNEHPNHRRPPARDALHATRSRRAL